MTNHTIPNDIDGVFGKRQKVRYVRLNQESDDPALIGKEGHICDLPQEIGVLNIQPCRTYWGGEQPQKGQSPICKSDDGKTGNTFGECNECEHSVWKNRQAPGCRASWEVMFALLDDPEIPQVFRCERSGFSAGLELARMKRGKVPYEEIVELGTTKQKKGTLVYFVPTFKEKRRATDEEIEWLQTMREELDLNGGSANSGPDESATPAEEDVPDFTPREKTASEEAEVDFGEYE